MSYREFGGPIPDVLEHQAALSKLLVGINNKDKRLKIRAAAIEGYEKEKEDYIRGGSPLEQGKKALSIARYERLCWKKERPWLLSKSENVEKSRDRLGLLGFIITCVPAFVWSGSVECATFTEQIANFFVGGFVASAATWVLLLGWPIVIPLALYHSRFAVSSTLRDQEKRAQRKMLQLEKEGEQKSSEKGFFLFMNTLAALISKRKTEKHTPNSVQPDFAHPKTFDTRQVEKHFRPKIASQNQEQEPPTKGLVEPYREEIKLQAANHPPVHSALVKSGSIKSNLIAEKPKERIVLSTETPPVQVRSPASTLAAEIEVLATEDASQIGVPQPLRTKPSQANVSERNLSFR